MNLLLDLAGVAALGFAIGLLVWFAEFGHVTAISVH